MKVIFSIILFFFGFELFAQEVRIGNQVVSTQDLTVTRFNNGDPIPIVKSVEESNSYALKGKPACMKVGASVWYNWYAVNDSRGIAPTDWHVPSAFEMDKLIAECREHLNWVLDKNNRTILPGNPTDRVDREPVFKWWCSGENNDFNDSYVERLDCQSSIGPLNLKAAKKADFYPVRVFANNPNQMFAREYFQKTQHFEVNTGNDQWKLVVISENCDSDSNEETECNGKAVFLLTNAFDSLEQYKIEIDDFGFVKKDGKIVSDLGVRFEDFNFDGQLDFGIGFVGNFFEFIPRVFFLDKVVKKAVFNREFNRLFLLGESSSFDLQTRTFEGITTMAESYEVIEYYVCPKDSLTKFDHYVLPSELSQDKINYPNVFLVNYFSLSDHELTRFNLNTYGFEQYTLDDWGYGEIHSSVDTEPYWVELTQDGSSIEVQKIDSATYYNAAKNIQENPFTLSQEGEDFNLEGVYLKRFGKGVKRKGDKLVLKPENGRELEYKNSEEPWQSYSYFGLTEDRKSWIVRQNQESEAYFQYIIDCTTGAIDSSMFSFPRYSPNGMYRALGDYWAMGSGGTFILHILKNGKWLQLVNVSFENLEFSFAPYDLFWIDDKTILVKQIKLKNNSEREEYFEYAKFTFDFK